MFTIQSRTTSMGNRAHLVTTNVPEFARQLLVEAQGIDLEPDFDVSQETFEVGFVAADFDARVAIESALLCSDSKRKLAAL